MRGLMMDYPLLISSLIEYAAEYHGATEIVSRTHDHPLHRTGRDRANLSKESEESMNATRTGEAAFTLELESEQEVRDEHAVNLAHLAIQLPTSENVPLHASLAVTLRGPWGGEAVVSATVVASLPDGLALGIEGEVDDLLGALLARPADEANASTEAEETDEQDDRPGAARQSAWDRIRGLSHVEKILLAVKAEKTDRSLLLQENDPRVLLSLLRNPRITVEEVARLARSPFLTYQIADVITRAAQWSGNLEVRIGLVRNPKTPQAFALRLLATLPDPELRTIAREGTSMALKQAALRRLQGKK